MSLDRPIFIHIIGLEGCGHHGVFPIFETVLTDRYGDTDTALYFRTGLRRFINGLYYQGYPKQECLAAMADFLEGNRNAIIVDDDSYPSHVYRDTSNQWDFEALYYFLRNFCDIRYACIKRNIFNTINSHRDWDGGLIEHARVLAAIAGFLDRKIAALEANGVEIAYLDYDRIGRNVGEISRLTGCDAASVERAIQSVFVESGKDYRDFLSAAEIAEIETLFDGV